MVAIGVKVGKSKRLIARELNVTATTISRDLEVLGITRSKKPTATRRKPAVDWKSRSQATSDSKVASQNPARPYKLLPRPVFTRRVVLEPPKPRPPKPLSPKQLRRQHLEEMLQLVGSWLLERKPDYWHAINVLDKARKSLAASPSGFYVRGLLESAMSAEQLRDSTRPEEMDTARGTSRTEEICAQWLARWLAAWEPKEEQLRTEVLDKIRALVTA